MAQQQITLQAAIAGVVGGIVGAVAVHALAADPQGPLPPVKYIASEVGLFRVNLRSDEVARCLPDPDGTAYFLCGDTWARARMLRQQEQQGR